MWVYVVTLTMTFGSARALADPGASTIWLEHFKIEKLAILAGARVSATFWAAVVLDSWACTAGRFGDCRDEMDPEV